jgi:hypothetical protein
MAAVLMATKGRFARGGLCLCSARDQLLAGTGLAGDQHRDVALAQAADGAEHVLHRRGLAQHLGRRAHALLGHFLALAFLDGAADQLHRLGQIEGLGQVLEGAALEGRDGAVQVGERRHDDHRQPRSFSLTLPSRSRPEPPRHADVADQHLRPPSSSAASSAWSTSRGLVKLRVGRCSRSQGLLQHEADRLVIIYDPDRLHGRASLWSAVRATESGS